MRLSKSRRAVWQTVSRAGKALSGRQVAEIMGADVAQVKRHLYHLFEDNMLRRQPGIYKARRGQWQYVYSTPEKLELVMTLARRRVLACILQATLPVDAVTMGRMLGLHESTVGVHALRLYEQDLVDRRSVALPGGGFKYVYMCINWVGEMIPTASAPKPEPKLPRYKSCLEPYQWWGDVADAIEANWGHWERVAGV